MSKIILTTLNARYHHSSFGLRYLFAQLDELQARACIKEYIIKKPAQEIAEDLLSLNPKMIGIGVYIWNTSQVLELARLLKNRRPDILLVLGGPEVSFETETQELYQIADFVFKGESDFLFRDFCRAYLNEGLLPDRKLISGPLPAIDQIKLPYELYSEEDIRNRVIYVEASRGCPYKCEYCLSSLDVSVRNFPLEPFLREMQSLLDRGARQFKFVDRTFNLSPTTSRAILQFFLDRIHLGLFLHFEMVPDRLPLELQELIKRFPKGSLQFEIGIQTWNPKVAANVSRRQNYDKIRENLIFLREHTGVHTHADLIVGLPGETLDSFARGFDALSELRPDEIQVGILKRLKGAPINKRTEAFKMVYSDQPPFQIQSNDTISGDEIRMMETFHSYWDRIANSGRLNHFMARFKLENEGSFFWKFFAMTRFLWSKFGRNHSLHFEELVDYLAEYAIEKLGWPENETYDLLEADLEKVGSMKRKSGLGGRQRQEMHL